MQWNQLQLVVFKPTQAFDSVVGDASSADQIGLQARKSVPVDGGLDNTIFLKACWNCWSHPKTADALAIM